MNSSPPAKQSEPTQEVIANIVATEQTRTKALLNELLADCKLPSNGPSNFTDWLEFVTSFIKKELVAAAASATTVSYNSLNNHQSVGDDSNSSESSGDSKSGNSNSPITAAINGNGAGDAATINVANSEVLLLQNAQLQKSLDEYKNIVADTVS